LYISVMNYFQETIERDVLQNIIVLPDCFQNSIKQNCAKNDIDIINASIERFNREAEENLLFQAEL